MRALRNWSVSTLFAFALLACEGTSPAPGTVLLEAFEPGTARAEVLTALPVGGIVATDPVEEAQLMHGYWMDRYFMDGAFVEVLWVYDTALGVPVGDYRQNLNPVIFRDQVLDGWGWEHFDLRNAEWQLVERQPAAGEAAAGSPVPGGSSVGETERATQEAEGRTEMGEGEEGAPRELPASLGATA